ncbi:hypothetical protein ACRYCC_40080 [Actinomadura scrupuli]|uniref:hypothetical protein n=1 Tax=Actinomadura scrupuli TaxID=559629 RepID=UPI003D989993
MSTLYEDVYAEIARGTAGESLPGWAMKVLEDVAAGRRPVEAVRHPLGFVCLPVERHGHLGVCLHLWSPLLAHAAPTTSQVHCHSWELVSFVLYGRLSNIVAGIGEGATHRVFEVVSHGDLDEIRATGRTVRYVPGAVQTHRTGAVYTLPAGVFHSTVVEAGHETATVALGRTATAGHTGQGRPAVPVGADLSLGALTTPTHRVDRRRCDAAETVHAARLSAKRLAATHAA